MSDQQAALHKALAAAQAKFTTIPRGKTVNTGTYTYQYADLADVAEAIRPVLAEQGLAVLQDVTTTDRGLAVSTLILHAEGGSLTFGPLVLPGSPRSAQDAGSAITYARRYALAAALGLVTDEDDDGKAASRPARTVTKRAPAQRDAPLERPATTNGAAEDEHARGLGFVSAAQQTAALKSLSAMAKPAGVDRDDRDAWLAFLAEAAGYTVTTSKDLTPSQIEQGRTILRTRGQQRAAATH